MAKLESLTPEQEKLMYQVRDEYINLALHSKKEVKEEEIRPSLEWMYKKMKLKPNPAVIICEGPLAMQIVVNLLKSEKFRYNVGFNIANAIQKEDLTEIQHNKIKEGIWKMQGTKHSGRAEIKNPVKSKLDAQTHGIFPSSLFTSIKRTISSSVGDSVGASVGASVRDSVWDSVRASVGDSVRDSVWDSVRDSVWASVGDSVRDSVGDSVWDSYSDLIEQGKLQVYSEDLGLSWESWIAFYDYFERIGILQNIEFDKYLAFERAGVWSSLFFENMVFICLLPKKILKDTQGRLHSTTEASAKWKSGEGYYFVHGVRFDKNLWAKIFKNRKITVKEAMTLENIEQRTVALQFIGWDVVLKDAEAKIIDELHTKNEKGEKLLYQVLDVALGDDGDVARFVRVQCHTTLKTTILRVNPNAKETKTCKGAIAWTFEMKEDEYNPLKET